MLGKFVGMNEGVSPLTFTLKQKWLASIIIIFEILDVFGAFSLSSIAASLLLSRFVICWQVDISF